MLPSLSYRRLNTRSYKDRKQQKSILNVSGQIGRSFRERRVRVTKGRGSKKTVVYFVAYACALNRTLIFHICKAESRKSESSLSCALGLKEPVLRELGPFHMFCHICLWTKKIFESYFRDRLTFSNIRSRTSRQIYRLALPLRAPETLSSLSKSSISIFNAQLTLFVHRMTSHNSIGKYRHLVELALERSIAVCRPD